MRNSAANPAQLARVYAKVLEIWQRLQTWQPQVAPAKFARMSAGISRSRSVSMEARASPNSPSSCPIPCSSTPCE